MSGYEDGLDVLGTWGEFDRGDMFGAFDMAAEAHKMNDLRVVPVVIAKTLLKSGQQVISTTQVAAGDTGDHGVKWTLTGAGDRKLCADHLQWHADELKKYSDPFAIYPNSSDLKKWTMQAYIESNAVAEGAAWMDQAWSSMWTEIEKNIAALPAALKSTVADVVSSVIPWYVWPAVGGGVLLLGYAAYKILMGPQGQHIVTAYVGSRGR